MNSRRSTRAGASRRELLRIALVSLGYVAWSPHAKAGTLARKPLRRFGLGSVQPRKGALRTGLLTLETDAVLVEDGQRKRRFELDEVLEISVARREGTHVAAPELEMEQLESRLAQHAEQLLADARDRRALEGWLTSLRRGYVAPLPIGPPIEGALWAVPDESRHHAEHAASAFALDLAKLDERGRVHAGGGKRNEDYAGFGAPLLAVADGRVLRARDTHPDHETYEGVADAARANDLVLQFESGLAFYQHLRQGSLVVEPGQTVQRGDVLATIGNSGNATWPHLHFALYEAFEVGGRRGTLSVPITFDAYRVTGLRKRVSGKAERVELECRNVALQEGWVADFS